MEFEFNSSPEPTLGVEIELQLVDRETRALTSAAAELIDSSGEVSWLKEELLQSTIEINSDVCADIAEAEAQAEARADGDEDGGDGAADGAAAEIGESQGAAAEALIAGAIAAHAAGEQQAAESGGDESCASDRRGHGRPLVRDTSEKRRRSGARLDAPEARLVAGRASIIGNEGKINPRFQLLSRCLLR